MFTWKNKENGMGVVIEKLPHPNKLTQKITKKWKRLFFLFSFFFFFFLNGFLERERIEKKISEFLKIF